MAGRGNKIIVTPDPRGRIWNGILSGALYPGIHLQFNVAYGIDSDDRHKFEVYTSGTDGKRRPVLCLLENRYLAVTMTTVYVSGDTVDVYTPLDGDELNCMKGDVSGTGDDFTIYDMLMIDTSTGELIATTGSPEVNNYMSLETITDPTADVLCHVLFVGN